MIVQEWREVVGKDGELITLKATKQIPGDVQAMRFWLKNRQPELWKENIAITLENSTLIITAEKTRKEITGEATKTIRTERSFGTLSRRFNLGQDIEQDNIEASFIDGLLTVSVFKVKKNQPVQRTIEIH